MKVILVHPKLKIIFAAKANLSFCLMLCQFWTFSITPHKIFVLCFIFVSIHGFFSILLSIGTQTIATEIVREIESNEEKKLKLITKIKQRRLRAITIHGVIRIISQYWKNE